jgi:hypothetical protein
MAKLSAIGRKEGTKSTHKTILIVCEGVRTEPDYFNNFRLSKVVETVGTGTNTLSLVKEAVRLNEATQYDEVWCVFDRDAFPKKNITAAFKLMREKKFNAAFSNEAFELWYVLHYCYLDTKNTRGQYCKILSREMGKKYAKNNPWMYDLLLPKQLTAIQNAKKLEKNTPFVVGNEADCIPVTSVYKLVERLNKLAKKYKEI